MKPGDVVSFNPHARDREHLPCFRRAVIGHAIECADQVDVLRVLKGDRLRIDELRGDHALVTHASCKDITALTACSQLEPIADQPTTEDHKL
jgi:hypothetical protein